MTDDRDIFIIRQSESGDYYLVPLEKATDFEEDDLNDVADYAIYIDLFDLQIYEYEV